MPGAKQNNELTRAIIAISLFGSVLLTVLLFTLIIFGLNPLALMKIISKNAFEFLTPSPGSLST